MFLRTAFLNHHPIILIWLKCCWERRKIASHPSIHLDIYMIWSLLLVIFWRNGSSIYATKLRLNKADFLIFDLTIIISSGIVLPKSPTKNIGIQWNASISSLIKTWIDYLESIAVFEQTARIHIWFRLLCLYIVDSVYEFPFYMSVLFSDTTFKFKQSVP